MKLGGNDWMTGSHEGGVKICHELVPANTGKDEPELCGVVLKRSRAFLPSDFGDFHPYLVRVFRS